MLDDVSGLVISLFLVGTIVASLEGYFYAFVLMCTSRVGCLEVDVDEIICVESVGAAVSR